MTLHDAEIILKTSKGNENDAVITEAMEIGGKCCEVVNGIKDFIEECSKMNDSDTIPKDLILGFINGCMDKED